MVRLLSNFIQRWSIWNYIEKLELVYLPKGKYCVYPRMVYRLAIVMPPLLIAFLAISDQYATFFFFKFTKWLPAAILDDRKLLLNVFHAISDQYTIFFVWNFFLKMATGGHFGSPIWPILDDPKSLLIAFLAISDQYTTFWCPWILCKRPTWPRKKLKFILFFSYF